MIRTVKQGSRIISIAGGPIQARKSVLLVGIVGEKNTIEGILSSKIRVNGSDSTDKIIKMISLSRFKGEIKILTLNGIALAGLNFVDLEKIKDKLGVHFLVITKKKPRPTEIGKALEAFSSKSGKDINTKINIVAKFSSYRFYSEKNIYILSDLPIPSYKNILNYCIEFQRIAHLVASGISNGESKGKI